MDDSRLKTLIQEQLHRAIEEKMLSEAEKSRKGTGTSKRTGRKGVYTSAGSVPTYKPKKNNPSVAKKRHGIGQKLMNLYARGDVRGTGKGKGQKSSNAVKFRDAVKSSAMKKFGNTNRESINSIIWATATNKAKGTRNPNKKSSGKGDASAGTTEK